MGYAVKLVSYDDQADLDTAINNAMELVQDPEILCGAGHFYSRITAQAAEIYHRTGLAFISPGSTRADVTSAAYLQINRVVGRDDVLGVAGARFAQERGFKAIYMLYNENQIYTRTNANGFNLSANHLGLNLMKSVSIDATSGFDNVIKDILAANTDLVYFMGLDEQIGNFNNDACIQGYSGAILGATLYANVLTLAGPFAIDGGGLYSTDLGAHLVSLPNAAQFALDFQTQFDSGPQMYSPYAYDVTGICIQAIEEAFKAKGGEMPARTEVAEAIRSLVDYQGITGTYTFNADSDPTLSIYSVYQVITIDPDKWGANPVVVTYDIAPPSK